ncbi:hypothetical protein, partial [Gemmiger formicilis]|uniref:hypothetical protein n=1 Tax=Gemmiger formicilis TaxID=745368 RepID=UPI003AB43609
PFRLWLAEVGRERIEETIDPEQAIDRDRVAGAPLKTAVGADSISARDVYGGAGFAGAYRMRPYVFVCAPKAQTPPSLLFII